MESHSTTHTHCPYCAMQCGMTLEPEGDGFIVATRDFPTNKGGLCRKGWTAAALLTAPGRLTTPLLRDAKGSPLRPATWDDAIDRIGRAFRRIVAESGRDSIGVFGGGGLTNEKAYTLGKFARVALGTANIDYNGRFCMASAAAANIRAFGLDRGLPFPIADIPDASVIVLVGANPAETMPPIMQYFDEQRRRGGQLIVVDPRLTATAKAASEHLQIQPGSDSALANGLLHILVRDRRIDPKFIAERTSGFEDVRRVVNAYWPDRVERITGVPAKRLEQTALTLGAAKTLMVLTARGPEQQSHGVDNVHAFINLVLALGQMGKPGAGYGCLTGQGNGQGGREHGQKADQLPGYRKLDNPKHRAEIAAVWNVTAESLPVPGLSACDLLDRCGGEIRAMLILGSNPVVSAPDAGDMARRLGSMDLLVVGDAFLSETAAVADVVLPVTQWAEEEGTMTNLEGAGDPPPTRARAAGRRPHRPRNPEGDRRRTRARRGVLRRTGAGFRRAASRDFGGRRRLRGDQLRTGRAGRRRLLALSDGRSPGHAEAVSRSLRDAGRARPVLSGRISRSRRGAGSGISAVPDNRTHIAALPVGNPDPPHRRIGSRRAGAMGGGASRQSARPRDRRSSHGPPRDPSRRRRLSRSRRSVDAQGHAVRAVSLERRRLGERPHHRCARSDLENSGVQSLRGSTRTPFIIKLSRDKDYQMESTPRFLQGIFPFAGQGLDKAQLLSSTMVYEVPADKRSQLIYLRAGNSSSELLCLSLHRDGKLMRLFPVGAKEAFHVSLAVVEDLMPDSKLEVFLSAPAGTAGMVVVDIGLLEI